MILDKKGAETKQLDQEYVTVWERLHKLPAPPSLFAVTACIGSAFLIDIAFRVGYPSLALFLGVATFLAVLAQLLFQAHNLRKNVSREAKETILVLCICLATASNFFLRSSPLVNSLTFLSLSGTLSALIYRLFDHRFYRWPLIAVKAVGDILLSSVWLAKVMPTFRISKPRNGLASIRGLLIGIVVVLPVLVLLASSDAVFASLFNPLSFGSVSFGGSLIKHVVLTGFLTWFLVGVLLSASREKFVISSSKQTTSSATATDYQIVVGLLTAVLGVWCLTQLAVALGGADNFLADNGISKADYARQGFFQLVAVTSIVLVTIAKVGSLVRCRAQQSGLLTKILVLLLAAETLALVVVAYSRLFLYIEAFALTITRLFVAWFLAWLTVMLLAAVVQFLVGFSTTSGFPKVTIVPFGVVSALVFVCCFGWFNPEAFIAETNMKKELSSNRDTDRGYLINLSDDAVEVVAHEFEMLESYEKEQFCEKDSDETNYGYLGWNKSRSDAQSARAEVCQRS